MTSQMVTTFTGNIRLDVCILAITSSAFVAIFGHTDMTPILPLPARLLRLSIFQKILFANLAVIAFGAVVGTVFTVWHVLTFPHDLHYELIAFYIVGGVAISYVINRWILHWAMQPLDHLQRAFERVRSGEPGVRVEMGAVSDERFERLADTFNAMVVRLERDAADKQRFGQRLIHAQEQERLRLARDLHDEAAQSLTSLLVRLRLLERAQTPEDARQSVEELRLLTATALEDVHRVAVDLRPTILDDLGLGHALEWRIDELNKSDKTRGSIEIVGMDKRLPRDVELVLYRVGQEALSNVQRHADAQNVWIRLEKNGGTVSLEVRDNGTGIATGTEQEGLGIIGMRERIAALDGQLEIESASCSGENAGAGTIVRARLQVNRRGLVHV